MTIAIIKKKSYIVTNKSPKFKSMFTQIVSHIHWLHIVVAAVAYYIIGAIWYSPLLFSKTWVKYSNDKIQHPDAKKDLIVLLLTSVVLMAVMVTGIEIVAKSIVVLNWVHGLKLGLFIGVAFSASSVSIAYLHQKKPFQLFLIDCGYLIIGAAVAGAILGYLH